MKKFLSIAISLFLVVSLSGCGGSDAHNLTDVTAVDEFGVYVEIPNYLEFSEESSSDVNLFYDYISNDEIKERFGLMKSEDDSYSSEKDLDYFIDGVVKGMKEVQHYSYEQDTFDVPVRSASFYYEDIEMYTFIDSFFIEDTIVSILYSNTNKDDCERIFDNIVKSISISEENYSDEDSEFSVDSSDATVGELNALEKAIEYLDSDGFSKEGLSDQLEYEGFEISEIDYAIDNVTVNWKDEAVEKALLYLESDSFSKSALIDQLEYEGFTPEEAAYGAEQAYK